MASNVVDINHRGTPMVAAEPDVALIEQIEWLLDAARSGEIQGLVGAFLHQDATARSFSVGWRSNALLGALEKRKHMLVQAMLED